MFHLTFGEKLLLMVLAPTLIAVAVAVSEDVVVVEALKAGRLAKERKDIRELADDS